MALFRKKAEYVEGEPESATSAKVPEVTHTEPVPLSLEQLKELISSVISETKKPNEWEQLKIDKERALESRRHSQAMELARAEEEAKAARKRTCPHNNGKSHTWVAQVMSPKGEEPYFIPTCQRCLTQLPRIKATQEQVTQGVNLNLYKTLDMAALEKWSENSYAQAKAG